MDATSHLRPGPASVRPTAADADDRPAAKRTHRADCPVAGECNCPMEPGNPRDRLDCADVAGAWAALAVRAALEWDSDWPNHKSSIDETSYHSRRNNCWRKRGSPSSRIGRCKA